MQQQICRILRPVERFVSIERSSIIMMTARNLANTVAPPDAAARLVERQI